MVKYARFRELLCRYFESDGYLPKNLKVEFTKMVRMAGYLADVDPESYKISSEYECFLEAGMVRI